jgi:hypothetical protein
MATLIEGFSQKLTFQFDDATAKSVSQVAAKDQRDRSPRHFKFLDGYILNDRNRSWV